MVSPASYLAVPAVGNDLTAPFYAVVEVDPENNQILAPEALKGQVALKDYVEIPNKQTPENIDRITCVALNMIYSKREVRFPENSSIGFMAQVLRKKAELISPKQSG